MILCDIGNSFYHFYKDGAVWREPISSTPTVSESDTIYTVSVNPSALFRLASKNRVVDIAGFFKFDTQYVGLGIDRAVACFAANDGIIVDAGSAITVDIMQEGMHLGGFILPGIGALKESVRKISPALDVGLNMGVSLSMLPQNTKDAISYGLLSSIVLSIKEAGKNKFIYFTGGDGKFLSKYFEDRCIVDDTLIFKGMMKIIQKEQQC